MGVAGKEWEEVEEREGREQVKVERGEGEGRGLGGGMAWAEDSIVNHQPPTVDKSPMMSEDATVASLNSHWRGGLPKLRSLLAMSGGGRAHLLLALVI